MFAMGALVAVVAGGLVARDLRSDAPTRESVTSSASMPDPPDNWTTLAELEAKPSKSAETRVIDAQAFAASYDPQSREQASSGGESPEKPATRPGLPSIPTAPPVEPQAETRETAGEPDGRINLNTANAAALERLPGVGPTRAEAILQTRSKLGGFRTIEDLMKVPGIGEKTLAKLRPMVTLGPGATESAPKSPAAPKASDAATTSTQADGNRSVEAESAEVEIADGEAIPRPVNINTATAEELDRIPGIGPALAARIIAHRNRAGLFKRPEDLVKVKGIGEKTFAKMRPWVTVK